MKDMKLRELMALRAKHGITQAEMANMLGISPSTYSTRELGKTPFTVPEVQKIIELFGAKFEDLFLPSNYGNSVVDAKRIPGTERGFEVDIKEG